MAESEPGTRSALIIAAERYEDTALARLRSPSQDAIALASVLADQSIGNYRVLPPSLNQPAHVVAEAIEAFFSEARLTDVLLLYLSCHGVKDEDGQLCFAMKNTKIGRLGSTSVTAEFLARQVKRSRSRRIVILLDCCYSGAFPKGFQTRSVDRVSVTQLWQAEPQGQGCVVITSCTATENAFEKGPGGRLTRRVLTRGLPSVFTDAVVEGLRTGAADRDRDGRISVDELYEYVYERVREHTPSQTPEKGGTTRGRLIVAWNPYAGIPPIPAPPRRRWHPLPVAIAAVLILGGTGTGISLALDRSTSAPGARGPFTVNTCARTTTSGPVTPVDLGSIPIGRPGLNKDFVGVAFSPDCHILAATGNGMVRVWNMVTGHLINALVVNSGGMAFNPAFAPDAKTVAVPGSNGTTMLWDVNTAASKGSVVSDYGAAGNTFAAILSRDGTRLFAGGIDAVVEEWDLSDLATRKPVRTIPTPSGIGCLALNPEGPVLAVGGADGTERLYDVATGKNLMTLPGKEGNSFAAAFSPDGKTLAVASQNGGVQWWDLTSRKLIGPPDTGGVTDVAFSPDGGILASGGYDRVTLWNTATEEPIVSLALGTAGVYVNGLAFSRYGGVLAVGYNGTLEFWNVAGVSQLAR
jgi:Caspase domain/WD domain, G-beta repeat/WD40-like Beta Propeller Repeat